MRNTNTNSLACTKRHDAKILDARVQAFVVQQAFKIPLPKIGPYIWIIMDSKHIYQHLYTSTHNALRDGHLWFMNIPYSLLPNLIFEFYI
jgi:hypothetical protein